MFARQTPLKRASRRAIAACVTRSESSSSLPRPSRLCSVRVHSLFIFLFFLSRAHTLISYFNLLLLPTTTTTTTTHKNIFTQIHTHTHTIDKSASIKSRLKSSNNSCRKPNSKRFKKLFGPPKKMLMRAGKLSSARQFKKKMRKPFSKSPKKSSSYSSTENSSSIRILPGYY